MKNITKYYLVILILLTTFVTNLTAQRPMEKLDRSVVAQKVSNGVYVNWRITADELYNTSYKLYRDGTLIYTSGNKGASNYLDPSGTSGSKYSVSTVKNGIESVQSPAISVNSKSFFEIPLREIKKLGKNFYYPNDATAADLDGDGQMEIILKRMNRNWDADNTNFTYFEAYKLDGTFMWAIDVGPNITMDVEMNIAAFDFDGDGKAEVFMRSSDNTIFGLDINNQNGISVGDRDGDGYTNYRQAPFNGIGGDGFMNAGPEYLSLIDGMTGKEIDWVNFIPRGNSNDWGDGYGHRANKFFFGAPYLDGKKPSLFTGRGIYTMTKMQTYDVINKKLIPKWYWEATSASSMQKGKWDLTPMNYFGQGYHNYTIADVDDDGKDEINWGSMTIDDDGKPLYSTGLGHGDAQHYGDFDPYRQGQEAIACNETSPGTNLRDAKTGKILYRHITPSDCGRVGAGNISDAHKGAEMWGGGVGLSTSDRVSITHFGVAESNCIYWDGDLLQEICDHSGFSTSTGVGYGAITKFNGYGNITTLLSADAYSCNYTKGTPNLQADIIGDWREEVIWWRKDSLALRVYSTPYPTNHRIYTLLHDHQYRQAICWQMCAYNQPPHTSFYLGNDFPTPIPPKATNGKLVWQGSSAIWSTSTPNFKDGDDASGLISGTGTVLNYSNTKSILFDSRASIKNIQLNSNLEPEAVTFVDNDNYSISGTGMLSGNMRLDKMGEGDLLINGNHSYTGNTEIWEGNLFFNGNLSASPVTVRRHAGFGGKAALGSHLITEHNASVYPGGIQIADSMIVNGNLDLAGGAKIIFDLSDNPNLSLEDAILTPRSQLKNDFLKINGNLTLVSGAIILVNQVADSLSEGKYLLLKAGSVTANLSTIKVQGSGGKSVSLTLENNNQNLYLIIKGTRSAGTIVWTGKTDGNWNIAKTANWDNSGYADIFVSNDSVLFDDSGINKTITINDSLSVANLEVNSKLAYTFNGTGVLTGPMNLIKSGTGPLYINTRNSYTGKTIVNKGSLILKYAPSATNNGGIGTNTTDVANLVLRDSAVLQITAANEITNRGLTVDGEAGGLLNVGAALYWRGNITGTKLTKSGSAVLFLENSNPGLNETVLTAGTLKLNSSAAVQNGVGKKITLKGGTLETLNSTGAYLSSNHIIDIPEGSTSTVIAGARCEYNGALTGGGTLNWTTDFIRSYINGDWFAFTGRVNILKNGANSTYEDKFIVNNASKNSFQNATVNLSTSGLIMCYKNGTADNGTAVIKAGMLTGVSGTTFYNAGLEVGSNNTNGTYAGIFTGSTSIKKIGSGLWILSGNNTNTGSINVSEGTVNINGSTGAGTISVASGAAVNLNGTAGGACVLSNGGVLSIVGALNGSLNCGGLTRGTGTITGISLVLNAGELQPGTGQIGTLTFSNKLTLNAGANLSMQINGGSTGSCDKIVVGNLLTCNGTLKVSLNSGTLVEGSLYKILDAASYTGTFSEIILPAAGAGLAWDTSTLYTDGTIKVIKDLSSVDANVLKSGLLQNPTDGIFRIQLENETGNVKLLVNDFSGKTIYQSVENSSDGIITVDIRNQPAGIYLSKIITTDGKTATHKLMKK